MESTLFTTLTVTEEATLSGGGWHKKNKPPTTTTPKPPTTPAPTPTPAPAKPTVSLSDIIQVNVITNSEKALGVNNISIG